MTSVLLVDDQPAVRQALRMRLAMESDITVVGESGDGQSAIRLVTDLNPDVVIMDIEMPGMDGITATRLIHASTATSAVVVLSMYDDACNRRKAILAGAAGFVAKHDASDALTRAIQEADAARAGCLRQEPDPRLMKA